MKVIVDLGSIIAISLMSVSALVSILTIGIVSDKTSFGGKQNT